MTVVSAARPAPAPDRLPLALLPGAGNEPLRLVESRLGAGYESVREARAFVRTVTRDWQLGELADDLALVVTELVANALRHGLGLSGGQAATEAQAVTLVLVRSGTRVMCLVEDPSPEHPVRRRPDPATNSGRGLQLVDSISSYWGWTALEDEAGGIAGKAVWAVFVVSGPRSGGRGR